MRPGCSSWKARACATCCKKLKPDRFEDIIAVVALYRPGPMDNIPRYIDCKHGRKRRTTCIPRSKAILKETYGIMIYQEQVMQIAQVLSGYTLGDADLLRRAMGKKIKEEMEAQRKTFIDGAVERKVNADKAGADLRPGQQVRRLRLQQEPRRRLCAGRLPDGVSEGELSGRVLRRLDDLRARQHRQAQRLPPGAARARTSRCCRRTSTNPTRPSRWSGRRTARSPCATRWRR